MNLTELKEAAKNEIGKEFKNTGYAEAVIDGELLLVIAEWVGSNKPGHGNYTKFKVIKKS